jgi:hypothetical protein
MKLRFLLVFAFAMAGCLFLGSNLGAGAQKDKDKKLAEIVVNDELINADLKDRVRTESFYKSYTFMMIAGKTYQIDMKSRAFDSFLRLENPDGMQVAEDDDSGGNLDARIIYRAPRSGDYTIFATSIEAGKGKFTLTAKEIIVPTIPLKLEKGRTVYSGNLLKTDLRFRNQKIHKLFSVEFEAGRTYQIDQASGRFDSYLYLEDPDGNIVAEDDDSGGNLNARIVHQAAKAGRFHIIATSLEGGNTGAFTLTVQLKKDK